MLGVVSYKFEVNIKKAIAIIMIDVEVNESFLTAVMNKAILNKVAPIIRDKNMLSILVNKILLIYKCLYCIKANVLFSNNFI